jgi:protein-S-isoprenylcysteine O-methyltransferase Ste14
MKRLSDWGFTPESWKGQRGEYWVLFQMLLLVGYMLLPVYRPQWLMVQTPLLYGVWTIALFLALSGLVLIAAGLLDLGKNLTPLPYPKPDGELVQTGIYAIVRHPLYSGLLAFAKAWAVWQFSLSHLIALVVLFVFFDRKAHQEEKWLSEKYPDYPTYQQRVKKLIPWVY